MNRKDFLTKLGAFVALSTVLAACKKKDVAPTTASSKTDFTIDISSSSYSALQSNGGAVYKNNIIIARTNTGAYVALSKICSHQGCTIQFNGSTQFPCPCHGAIFDLNGNPISGPTNRAIQKYNTSLNGNMLRVFS